MLFLWTNIEKTFPILIFKKCIWTYQIKSIKLQWKCKACMEEKYNQLKANSYL